MDTQVVRAAGVAGYRSLVDTVGDRRNAPRLSDMGVSNEAEGDHYIGYLKVIETLEAAAQRLNCPDFGMRLAQQQDFDVFGALGVIMRHEKTIRSSYNKAEQYLAYHSPAITSGLRELPSDKYEFLAFDVDISQTSYASQHYELSISLIHRCLQHLSGGIYQPHEVLFRHMPVAPLSTYRRVFGITPKFGAATPGIILAKQYLDCAITNHSQVLSELAEYFLKDKCPVNGEYYSAKTREIIRHQIADQDCTQADAARMMGVSARTLQRRLQDENTNFDSLRDEIRRAMAEFLLKSTDLSITQVSERLHYGESSALTRSCYRWFGMSPRKLRQQARNDRVDYH